MVIVHIVFFVNVYPASNYHDHLHQAFGHELEAQLRGHLEKNGPEFPVVHPVGRWEPHMDSPIWLVVFRHPVLKKYERQLG